MIKLNKVTKIYSKNNIEKLAIDKIDLTIGDGELVAVMGKSGAGKTALLKMLGCMDLPTCGSYELNGKEISKLNDFELSEIRYKELGIIMQEFFLIDELSAIENVKIPTYLLNTKKHICYDLAMDGLCAVGFNNYAKRTVAALSGEEKQKVAIARALVNNPKIILADEPTEVFGYTNTNGVMEIFKKINKQGKTVIINTKDIDIARQCNRIITIEDGRIISDTGKRYAV